MTKLEQMDDSDSDSHKVLSLSLACSLHTSSNVLSHTGLEKVGKWALFPANEARRMRCFSEGQTSSVVPRVPEALGIPVMSFRFIFCTAIISWDPANVNATFISSDEGIR